MGRGKKVESVLSELPEPTESQVVVCVKGIPGGNVVQVQDAKGNEYLCRLPAKFRNVMWIKKGGHPARSRITCSTRSPSALPCVRGRWLSDCGPGTS